MLLVAVIGLSGCQSNENKTAILGDWSGVAWEISGRPATYNPEATYFTFRDDKTYSYSYADHEEDGAYYIVGHELYTTPEGGTKMMVKIKHLTPDSLVFEMNRGGTLETLSLKRDNQ